MITPNPILRARVRPEDNGFVVATRSRKGLAEYNPAGWFASADAAIAYAERAFGPLGEWSVRGQSATALDCR